MKIATIQIHEYPTIEQQTHEVTTGGSLDVEITDMNGNKATINIASLLAIGEGGYFVETFKHATFEAVKDKIDLKILQEVNSFNLSASQQTDKTGTSTDVVSHSVKMNIYTFTTDITNPVVGFEKVINIEDDIIQADKDEFTDKGLTLTGANWNKFTVEGNSKIEFSKVEDTTVFVGNKQEGFITTD